MHGANSTLNKGATGLPLRASAVVGHEEGRGRGERDFRERDNILCIERGADDAQRGERGTAFLLMRRAHGSLKALLLHPILG